MKSYYIKADKFYLKNVVEGPGFLEIINGKIGKFNSDTPDGEIIDYSGFSIAPGLFDTHIHGMKGHDLMNGEPEDLFTVSNALLENGVTSFLPTTLTSSIEQLNKVTKMIGENYKKVQGAKVQGIYLEGPFFTEKHKGAQNPGYFMDPNIEVFNKWQELSDNLVVKIAMAPERKGAVEFIDSVTNNQKVKVALGHSDASYQQAKKAVESGASIFVHTYNGMRPLTHREPGMVGAALSLNNIYAELICDGHHVSAPAIKIVHQTKGDDHTVLITDCMSAGAMPEGEYMLGEFKVDLKDGKATLQDGGSLAGSILRLNEAVHNIIEQNIDDKQSAISMASYSPAKSMDMENICGSLSTGMPADFIVIDDQINVHHTYVDGVLKYSK